MKRSGAATAGSVRAKGSLDRATIVSTALLLLDEVGIDGLSTRRLAAELGIKSASLYWHFKDKNELLNEMSGAMFEECLPAPNVGGANFDWAEWLAEGARAIRRTALTRRDGAQVMARPRPRAPVGRAAFEENVKTVMRSGLADMEARLTMQTLRRYAIGAALQEQSNKGGSAAVGIVGTGEEGFEFGLQVFIDGLKARLAERAKVAKSIKKRAG
ncbi:MAG: TetR/AcrR family transcriptional regulator C-terminal domain-containing protein [Hyphomonadaceae bacterium]|nr:TetR/AcrR family transcriptional regulator C-terminal domain-containing protein [Hyphomonadaceae bacterium]